MIQLRKGLIGLLLISVLSFCLANFARATTMTLTVPAGKEKQLPIDLVTEDRISIGFTVVGTTESVLDFHITDPSWDIRVENKGIAFFEHDFVCDEPGEYILHFDNKGSLEDKFVALNYEIQHYISGVPQMLFLTIMIVLICIVALAAFILMGKTY